MPAKSSHLAKIARARTRARITEMQQLLRAERGMEARLEATMLRQTEVSGQVSAPFSASSPTAANVKQSPNYLPVRNPGDQAIVHYLQEMEERVVARMAAEIARLYGASEHGAQKLSSKQLQDQDEASIQQALPELPNQSARDWQNEQNALLRNQFIAQCGALLNSHEVADLLQSQAKNRAATANQLKDKGRALCLRLHSHDVYPAFQFDMLARRVYPEMATIIHTLYRDYEANWQLALWFIAPNPWLAGQTPLALWASDRSAIIAAAQAQAKAFDA